MKKICLILAVVVLLTGMVMVHAWMKDPTYSMMEYRVTAEPGDTVWSICARIATDRDDLSRVVWQSMRDSHIDNAADLQPGQEIIVRVQAVEDK